MLDRLALNRLLDLLLLVHSLLLLVRLLLELGCQFHRRAFPERRVKHRVDIQVFSGLIAGSTLRLAGKFRLLRNGPEQEVVLHPRKSFGGWLVGFNGMVEGHAVVDDLVRLLRWSGAAIIEVVDAQVVCLIDVVDWGFSDSGIGGRMADLRAGLELRRLLRLTLLNLNLLGRSLLGLLPWESLGLDLSSARWRRLLACSLSLGWTTLRRSFWTPITVGIRSIGILSRCLRSANGIGDLRSGFVL